MSPESHRGTHREDAVILEVLDRLVSGEPAEIGGDPEVSRLARIYTEVLGLLPLGLEPVAPPPELKQRLMRRVRAAQGERPGRIVAADETAADASAGRGSLRWALRLAAVLAVFLVGASGWLAFELKRQRTEVAALSARLEEELGDSRAELVALRSRLARAQGTLDLVTAPRVEICALRPRGATPPFPDARGVLYVAADRQNWFLAAHGLEPVRGRHSYQLWFIADGVPVSAGTFEVIADEKLELSSEAMPAGFEAVTITLEPAGGSAQPTGATVLYGDQIMLVL